MSVDSTAAPGNLSAVLDRFTLKTPISNKKEAGKSLLKIGRAAFPSLPKDQMNSAVSRRSEVQAKLSMDFLLSSIQETFPVISPDLFSQKRFIVVSTKFVSREINLEFVSEHSTREAAEKAIDQKIIQDTEKPLVKTENVVFEIPLIVIIPENQSNTAKIGKLPYTGKDSYGDRHYELDIYCPVPPRSTSGILFLKSKALAAYHIALGKMAKNINTTSFVEGTKMVPEFLVGWIPTPESMKMTATEIIQDKDPALFMRIHNEIFLIGTWDIEEEKPIEAYLREFSSGTMKNVVRVASSK